MILATSLALEPQGKMMKRDENLMKIVGQS